MKMEKELTGIEIEKTPRSNAYAYVLHSIFENGVSVYTYDNVGDGLDALCERGMAAKITGLITSVLLHDDKQIAAWVRVLEEERDEIQAS